MVETSSAPNRPFRLLVWTFLAEILLLVVLVPNHWLTRVVETENRFLVEEMGNDTADWVVATGARWYDRLFVTTGINEQVYRYFVPTRDERRASRGLANLGATSWFPWVNGRATALSTILQQVLQRVALFSAWGVFFALVCAPFIWDGLMQWKIKQYSFRHASTAAHSLALSFIGFVLLGLLVGIFLPAPIPPVAVPILMIAVLAALNVAARHTQKEV